MNNKLQKINSEEKDVFSRLRYDGGESGEYWSARELQKVLGYTKWENFSQAILRAKKSFDTSFTVNSNNINDHFRKVRKMVGTGSGAEREVDDYRLSKYACYLIAQNGDPTKKPIALAQAYFNIQTFRQEFDDQTEKDRARLERRKEFTESDKRLSENIAEMGISARGIAEIKDSGNKVFFGGNDAKDMAKKLETGKKPWPNRASNVVLAGKTLANELTSSSIENRGVGNGGVDEIREVNDDNNKAVRETIYNRQGLYPEEFPPAEDTDKVQKRLTSNERRKNGNTYNNLSREGFEAG